MFNVLRWLWWDVMQLKYHSHRVRGCANVAANTFSFLPYSYQAYGIVMCRFYWGRVRVMSVSAVNHNVSPCFTFVKYVIKIKCSHLNTHRCDNNNLKWQKRLLLVWSTSHQLTWRREDYDPYGSQPPGGDWDTFASLLSCIFLTLTPTIVKKSSVISNNNFFLLGNDLTEHGDEVVHVSLCVASSMERVRFP